MDKMTKAPIEAAQFKLGPTEVSVDEEKSTFEMRPYKKGQVVEHWYWDKFVFETDSMRMKKDVIPALVDHDTMAGAGAISEMSIDEFVSFKGEFVENQHSEYVKSMRGLMETSLRFDLNETDAEYIVEGAEVEVDGFKHEGPLYVFRNAPIMESSFTLFGHVPDTSTSFNKQETPMADAPNPTDVRASVTSELAKFSSMCSDAEFVLACFNKGMSIEQFSSELLTKQSQEITSLKEKNESLEQEISELKAKADTAASPAEGAPVVEFSSSEGAEAEGADKAPADFMSAIESFKGEGMDARAALTKAAQTYPELYAKHTGRV